jgi:polyhydroxybutyrate depolymerase
MRSHRSRFPLFTPTARRLLAAVVGVVAVAVAGCSEKSADMLSGLNTVATAGGTADIPIDVGTSARHYVLHVPEAGADSTAGRPLILVLHGSSQSGETIRQLSGMDSVADADGVIVAYPDGVGGDNSDWNAGDCCGYPQAHNVDDIAFLRAVIANISSRSHVNRARVYVAGFSDGARMAYRVACEMSTEVAAVAAVSGSLETADCAPARAVPVIAFHGTADESVPYDDSAHTDIPTSLPKNAYTLPPAVQFWLGADRCRGMTSQVYVTHVVRTTGWGCSADVTFYSIAGGTHEWPDTDRGSAVSASPIIARFFLAHALK